MTPRTERGFTLIELLVTLAIIAILATIAYPLYTQQAREGRRSDAKVALEQLALAEERYYTANGGYADSVAAMSAQIDAIAPNLYQTAVANGSVPYSSSGFYSLSVTGTTQAYTATASAAHGQQADTQCTAFRINQLGQRTATNSGGTDTSKTCW